MTTITVEADCGNAPKKRALRDLNVAFAENDAEFILDSVSDDVEWTVVGDRELRGKDELADALEQMADGEATALTVDHVVTHGATGAVDGTLEFDDGETYAFCDVYEFDGHAKDAKVRTTTSCVVESEGERQ